MVSYRPLLIGFMLLALMSVTPALGQSSLDRIEAAHAAGEIDDEQYVMYRLYRVTDRDRLPMQFQVSGAQERPVRCATPMVRAAQQASPWLSPAARADVEQLLALPEPGSLRYDSYYSDNFAVIVGDAGGVSQPQIDFWLETFEYVWDVEIDTHNFGAPPCTGQSYFDVWLANTGTDAPDLEQDTYGYTSHYGNDCPFVVVHQEFEFDPNPEGAAQVTAAHEFFHAIQSGYDWFEGDYWMEATATWAEELVYDDVNDYLSYINNGGWMEYPEAGLTYEDGWHEYGNVVWVLYLDDFHGGPDTIRNIWAGASIGNNTAMDAMESTLGNAGSSLDEAFLDFTGRIAVNDFPEGDGYDNVWTMETHNSYPVEDVSYSQYKPEPYGSNHVIFDPSGPAQRLRIEFDGAEQAGGDDVQWGLVLVSLSGGTPSYQVVDVAADGTAVGTVTGFGGSVDRVRMVVAVIGNPDTNPGTGADYSYSATLDDGDDDDDDDNGDDDSLPEPVDDDDDGCKCSVLAASPSAVAALPLMLACLLVLRRRG